MLATNTSSLPVTEIAEGLPHPERVCGMHFFNPPALMKLVEVVATADSADEPLAALEEVARAMGREPVRCTDSPGFIVNRCNRPYTLESLRILDEGIATHAQIDEALRSEGGYRMGPFELMDLIGIDVNLEVARSFYRQRPEPRWQPHEIQERMVASGRLGRKTGAGFYEYGEDAANAEPEPVEPELSRAILERVVAQLANEASFAAGEGVAEPRRHRLGDAPWPQPSPWPVRVGRGAGRRPPDRDSGRAARRDRGRALRGRPAACERRSTSSRLRARAAGRPSGLATASCPRPRARIRRG